MKIKMIAIYLAMLALVGTNLYVWHCYQKECTVNENLTHENKKLRQHVELLAAKSIDMMRKLEAANDRAESMLAGTTK